MKKQTKTEWDAFRQMSPGKQAEHILIYYRWQILAGIAVIITLVSLTQLLQRNNRERMISGIFVNNAVSREGYTFLGEDYLAFCGGGNRRVELVEGRSIEFGGEYPSEDNAANLMLLASLLSSGELDYIITDAASLPYLEEQQIPMDLRRVLPAERLAALDTVEGAAGIIAIRLTETGFAERFSPIAEDSFILVACSSADLGKTADFLEYLLAA